MKSDKPGTGPLPAGEIREMPAGSLEPDTPAVMAHEVFIASVAPMLQALGYRRATLSRLLAACHEPVRDDQDLQERMALIDELYANALDEQDAAARFAEAVTDRVHEYEVCNVEVPCASAAEALAFLMSERGVRAMDLAGIVTRRALAQILEGKRALSMEQIQGLAGYFNVPALLFMHNPS